MLYSCIWRTVSQTIKDTPSPALWIISLDIFHTVIISLDIFHTVIISLDIFHTVIISFDIFHTVIISLDIFHTVIIFLHAYSQVIYYHRVYILWRKICAYEEYGTTDPVVPIYTPKSCLQRV